MLRHIYIKDFAIISHLDLELSTGMTVITGETGAGKSIVIDALDMALGERADSRWIRHGCERCDIALSFDVTHIPLAKQWLIDHELADANDCHIRRSINTDGRSRSFINGQSVSLAELKALGAQLVHIHSQHEHQHLIKHDEQRRLLDDFAGHEALLQKTATCYQALQTIEQAIADILAHKGQSAAERELLAYQLEELNELSLKTGEFAELSLEQQQLTHAEHLLQSIAQAQHLLCESEQNLHVKALLENIIQQLRFGEQLSPTIANVIHLLDSALVEISEASHELNTAMDSIHVDPERLAIVEQRLSQAFQLARKHKVRPEELAKLESDLAIQLTKQADNEEMLKQLREKLPAATSAFTEAAKALHLSRVEKAYILSHLITQSLHQLHMQDAIFHIQVHENDAQASALGISKVEFWVSTNKGQPEQTLAKIASGGELSRVSLAIQVITAKHDATPTLVFDEVDVGIGGATAGIVGQLLRQLGAQTQVLCITHLPQVAAQGHHHVRISKYNDETLTHSSLETLATEERVKELARMLGGTQITAQTLAHAEEMLNIAVQ